MKPAPLPPYEVRTSPVPGTFYRSHAIVIDGEIIYSQLGKMTDEEIEGRIMEHLHPPKTQHVKEFTKKPGPKPLRVRTLDDDLPPDTA